jgi:exosome complex component RRP41
MRYLEATQSQAGVLSAAINACTLALVHAGIAVSSLVSSVTVACLHDVPLLDPSAPEESDLPSLAVACLSPDPKTDEPRISLVNLETRLSLDRFEAMLRLAAQACDVIRAELNSALRAWAEEDADHAQRMRGAVDSGKVAANAMDL